MHFITCFQALKTLTRTLLITLWSMLSRHKILRIPHDNIPHICSAVLDVNISNVQFCFWEPLEASGSCQTRISGWFNPKVYGTDAVACRCIWEHQQTIWMDIGYLLTTWGGFASTPPKHVSINDKSECTSKHHDQTSVSRPQLKSTNNKPGSARDMLWSISYDCRPVQDKHILSECCWCTCKSQLQSIIQWFFNHLYSVCILVYSLI